jgi:hypothetical protein
MSGVGQAARGPRPEAHTTARAPERLPFELPLMIRALDGDADVDAFRVAPAREPDGRDGVEVSGRGRCFAAHGRWRRRDGALDRWDVELDVRSTATAAVEAGLVVSVRLGPAEEPQWLIPGLFYGENRPATSRSRYPRFDASPAGSDPWAASSWGFRADRAAIPVVYARAGQRGVALGTTEVGPFGLNGLGFGLALGSDDRSEGASRVPELRLAFPYREEPVAYDGSPGPLPPDRPGHRWDPGETVTLRFSVYGTPAVAYGWVPVLDDIRDVLAPGAPLNPWLDPHGAAALAAEGLLRWHARPTPPVLIETAAFERRGDGNEPEPGDREAMHVGWLSGAPAAAALVRHGRRSGNAAAIAVGSSVLNHIAANLAPCGSFWGQWTADRGWTKGWTPGEDQLHARTLAEAALFMLRAAALDDHGDAGARWRIAVASNLDFVAARQRDDGAIPAAWNARSGEPATFEGCAGLAWVPALIEAAALLDRGDLLEPARRAGAYYARFVDAELLFGAPEDVDLGPTSEDGYVAVMAYVALAEAASGPEQARWIELASRAADWMLTFRYAWNVAFDASSVLGRLDYRTRGMDQASPANQHLHTYGLVALAETVRLARLNRNERLLDRSREHLAGARQLIARFDGDFGARRGMLPERAYQTACFGPKGEIGRLSHAWCLGLLLWACEDALDIPELGGAAP